jgi:hypothetical protein
VVRWHNPLVTLAHGAAGAWDELVLVLCPLVFLGILIIAGRRRPRPPGGAADSAHDSATTDTADD